MKDWKNFLVQKFVLTIMQKLEMGVTPFGLTIHLKTEKDNAMIAEAY